MLYEKGNVKYDMVIDSAKKTFHLSAFGFFKLEDGNAFINDYNRLVKTFRTEDYYLIIDGSELKASSPEVAELLGQVLVRYIEVPYARRFLLTQGSAVTLNQFKRLGSLIPGWDKIEYVEDIKAVHNAI